MIAEPKTNEAYKYSKSHQGLTNSDSLLFHRWLKDSESLIKVSPADGYILQGFAHSLLGNAKKAIESMKKAKMLNNYFGKVNYAWLSTRFGEYEESCKVCFELLRQDPTDSHVFSIMLDNADFALNADLVKQALELYQGDDMDLDDFLLSIDKKTQLLEDVDIDKATFINIKKLLFKFLSKHYYGDYALRPFIVENEIGKRLDLNVYLNNVDIEHCLELNDVFMDTLIDDDNLSFDDYKNIIVHFVPAEYQQVA